MRPQEDSAPTHVFADERYSAPLANQLAVLGTETARETETKQRSFVEGVAEPVLGRIDWLSDGSPLVDCFWRGSAERSSRPTTH